MNNTLSAVLVLLCTIFSTHSYAQVYRTYSTQFNSERLKSEVSSYNFALDSVERVYNNLTDFNFQTGSIKVIFHVLYDDYRTRITPSQIETQLNILNQAYLNANHFGSLFQYPELNAFDSQSSNPNLMFCLADDLEGSGVNPINYKQSQRPYWEVDDEMKFNANQGYDNYDPDHYLNIWICSLNNSAGYAQYPGGPSITDGIVIDDRFFEFGSGGAEVLYDGGKTLVHLVGNYLGLRDLWNENVECGDDKVGDTPLHNGPNYTLGKNYFNRSTCDMGFEMVMNYMDNTPDEIQYLFTVGQVKRLRAPLHPGSVRHDLFNSSLCLNRSNVDISSIEQSSESNQNVISIHPNPTSALFIIDYYNVQAGAEVQIINLSGNLIYRLPLDVNQNSLSVDLSEYADGVYVVHLKDASGILNTQKLIKLSK